jgi:Tol biopolymer transport system component
MDSDLIGTRLGKYDIQAEIGRGGMGAVYKGYDPLLDRYVAVKVLAPHLVWQTEFVERFLREARAAARLKHSSIVTIHDVGQEGGWYYFVMEYLEGQTLTDAIQQRGPLPPDEVLSVLRPLADALDYAHHRGLIHRDIKPGNVIVGPAGLVTLTDFGIARAAQETRLTATGTIVGTPEYMSPEQARGLAVDARSDQYSLAVVAYEMLSGEVPFQAESTLALLHKIAYEPPPPICQARPDLPAGVEAVLDRALAKEPGDRYATVSAFVDALGRALAGEEVERAVARLEVVAPPVEMPTEVLEPEAEAVPPSAAPPAPEPEVAAVPMPGPGRTKVMPGARPAAPLRRRVPVWAWALGGLVVLALVVGVVMAAGRGRRAASVAPPALPTTAAAGAGSMKFHLVFVSDRDGKREIYHLTEDGEVVRITRTPGEGESWGPTLAPDGTVLFTSNRDGKWEVYHLTEEGEVVQITRTPGQAGSGAPAMGPDGTIFFASNRDGKREIYHLTGEGDVVQITRTPGDGESWSPAPASDGTVLFTSNRDGKQEIYHLAGEGEVAQITRTPGEGESWSPALAPDGTVLFTSDRDGKREIYHLTEEGEVERITRTPGEGESWSPALAPDGTVLFTSNRDGKREVYHLTGEGEVVRITRTPGDGESWLWAW